MIYGPEISYKIMLSTRHDRGEDILSGSPSVRWTRIYAFLIGFFVFAWLPFEDPNLRWVIMFSAAIAVWIGVKILGILMGKWSKALAYPLSGLLAGLCLTLIALGLMLIKNGLHGHDAPDFTYEDVVYLLQISYVWVVVGTIIGTGLLLIKLSRQLRKPDTHANRS